MTDFDNDVLCVNHRCNVHCISTRWRVSCVKASRSRRRCVVSRLFFFFFSCVRCSQRSHQIVGDIYCVCIRFSSSSSSTPSSLFFVVLISVVLRRKVTNWLISGLQSFHRCAIVIRNSIGLDSLLVNPVSKTHERIYQNPIISAVSRMELG